MGARCGLVKHLRLAERGLQCGHGNVLIAGQFLQHFNEIENGDFMTRILDDVFKAFINGRSAQAMLG